MFIDGENYRRLISKIIRELLKFKPYKGKNLLIQAFNSKNLGSISKVEPDKIKIKAISVTKKHFSPTARELNPLTTNKI